MMPKRKETDVKRIIEKTKELKKPKIQLHGTTLMAKLQAIEANVNNNLGDYECILLDSDDKWLQYCKDACNKEYTALDTETTGLTFNDQGNLVGVCIQSTGMLPAYAPVGHTSVVTEMLLGNQVSKEAVKKGFEILLAGSTKYIFHNAYYDLVVLYLATGYWIPVEADTQLIAFSLNENEPHGLKYLYDKYVMGGEAGVHKFAELFDGIPANYVSPKVFMKYSAHDSEMTLALFNWYLPFITKGTPKCIEGDLEGISDILYNVEFPLTRVLAEMKVDGIDIDYDVADNLRTKYTKLKEESLKEFNEAVAVYELDIKKYNIVNTKKLDYPINYNSPSQIKALFYDIIKTGVIFKKEPNGTGSHVLDELLTNDKYKGKPIYKIANALREVKKYDKLIGSFIDKLSQEARYYGGVIHGNFKSCGAKTSRMSSSEPKQNWAYAL